MGSNPFKGFAGIGKVSAFWLPLRGERNTPALFLDKQRPLHRYGACFCFDSVDIRRAPCYTTSKTGGADAHSALLRERGMDWANKRRVSQRQSEGCEGMEGILSAALVFTYTDGAVRTLPFDLEAPALALDDGRTSCRAERTGRGEWKAVYTLTLRALESVPLRAVDLTLRFGPALMEGEPLLFQNSLTTNGFVDVRPFAKGEGLLCRDVLGVQNGERRLHAAFLTVDRFLTWFRLLPDGLRLRFHMENKPLTPGEDYRLERFALDTAHTTPDFLALYARSMADAYHVRTDKPIPTGWCSWSIFYSGLTEQKVLDVSDGMRRHFGDKKLNLVQLDDSWQTFETFSGDWSPHAERFPRGLAPVAEQVNRDGFDFGLWLAPTLVGDESPLVTERPELLLHDTDGGLVTTLLGGRNIYTLDLGKPEALDYLHEVFTRCCEQYGSVYFKLDFLIFSLFRGFVGEQEDNWLSFSGDYAAAVYRRAMQTIRDAVGPDRYLLACGATVSENLGIFDGSRVAPDIIIEGDQAPEHWPMLRDCARNLLLRGFYNGVWFWNDPDGVVVRDYDCGDQYSPGWHEARFWATACAFSGGSLLLNEQPDKVGPARLRLFEEILPPLGRAAQPLDFYEQPGPTISRIDCDGKTLACVYNPDDRRGDRTLPLDKLGFAGDCIVLDCWEKRVCGIYRGEMPIRSMPAHSANVYLICPLPQEPAALGATGNLYMGVDTVEAAYRDGKLCVRADEAVSRCRENDLLLWLPAGFTLPGEREFSDPRGCVLRLRGLSAGETLLEPGRVQS